MMVSNPSSISSCHPIPTISLLQKLAIDVANLQLQQHDPITIDELIGGLFLNNQKLALKIDPSSNNLLIISPDGLLVDLNAIVAQIQVVSSARGNITRRTIAEDLYLSGVDTTRQNIINQSGMVRGIFLPPLPLVNQEFEIINNFTSTSDLVFAGETIIPGDRHAVQWDGVEWVEL